MGNHLFVIFAVLDVSRAVNSCINHSFFYIYNTYIRRPSPAINKRRRATQQYILFNVYDRKPRHYAEYNTTALYTVVNSKPK